MSANNQNQSPPSPSRFRHRLGLLVLAILSLAFSAAAQTNSFVPGQILIKPRARLADSTLKARLDAHGAWQRKKLSRSNIRVINVTPADADKVLAQLRRDPDLEFAERDAVAHAAFVPNDPYVASGDEWHLAKIQAPPAWDRSRGNPNLVVAVLDSGVNAAHPDLAGHLLPGWNFVANNANPADDFGHGTAVAGVIAASGNNQAGVAGIAWRASILPIKVANSTGFASYSAIAEGIRYATDHGARVINLSIAGDSPSATLQDAIDYAWSQNVLIIAAAGNTGNDLPQYPAACNHVVAVSATEPDDSLASFSTYGNFVSVAAPGDTIWTTQSDLSRPYGSWRGTSFASPIVAGIAALVASANPSLSNTQLVSLLALTADDRGALGYDSNFGFGRINALNAVIAATNNPLPSLDPFTLPPTISLITGPAEGDRLTTASLSLAGIATSPNGIQRIETQLNDDAFQIATGTTNWSALLSLQPGINTIRIRALDSLGNYSATISRSVFLVVLSPFTLQIDGRGAVTPSLNGRFLEVGRTYLLRAAPAAGQVFAGWQGADTEAPVLAFVMQPNLVLQADFVPSPFPAIRGGYIGLLANTNDVTPETSGYFMLTLTASGSFTGKILGATASSFSGQFNHLGEASLNVPRGALGPIHLNLHADLTNATDQISGDASDGAWTSQISADRNSFSSSANSAPQAGARAFTLQDSLAGSVAAMCNSRIAAAGTTSLRGRLVDGRGFVRTSALAKNGDCPFYLSLRQSTEAVIGWLNFPVNQSPDTLGSVLWIKTGTNAFSARLQAASLK